LHKRCDIPYVLDFRDLWNNKIMSPDYSPTLTERVNDFFIRIYWKKWLSEAVFITTTSVPWTNKLINLFKVSGQTIRHGYDERFKKKTNIIPSKFYITYAGSTSGVQQLERIAKAIGTALDRIGDAKVQVRFLGSIRKSYNSSDPASFIDDPSKILGKWIPATYLKVTPRISRNDVFKAYQESQILLLPSYVGLVGTYSGKLFEYLGARRNILVFPSDKGVIEEIILQTKAGVCLSEEEAMVDYLIEKYSEWQKNGEVKYDGIEKELTKYSREFQVEVLANHLDKYFGS
jgi:glycosyltransferase involved in cell wall biosynthesis